MIRSLCIVFCLIAALPGGAAIIQETFATDPLARGWRVFGDTSLFHWNATNQNLEVTWDSSRTNSYFYRPLGTVVGKDDEFSLAFDLRLADIVSGVTTNKPYTFQLALGFLQLATATNSNFVRGSGNNSTDLVEWNYFPAFLQFDPTIAQVVVSTNGRWFYNHDNLRELTPGDLFHVAMQFRLRTLTTTVTRNGAPYGDPQAISLETADTDFRVDTVAVISYSDAGQDPRYAGSILAHGVVDNLVVTTPLPPITAIAGQIIAGHWQVQFQSRDQWRYVLERTEDFQGWIPISAHGLGNGASLILTDATPLRTRAFYRVKAIKP